MLNTLIAPFRASAAFLGSLLSESAHDCPLCRTAARGSHLPSDIRSALPADATLNSLCRACASQIPWIGPVECVVCGRHEPCGDCARRSNAHFICSRSAVRYDERIREWLALFKYRGDERLAQPLADMLDIAFLRLDRMLVSRMNGHLWDAAIPVPVSFERLAERGFNQAERLAELLCARRGLPLRKMLLRTRHSEKKSLQSRAARLKSAKGLFVADESAVRAFIEERSNSGAISLLIIDDIYTTGSTIEACSEAVLSALQHYLPAANIQVYAVTLARS